MGDGVFFRDQDGALMPMTREGWALEDKLQELVAECLDLLSGDGESGAWLLVRREYGIADVEEAPDRWSVDVLALDSEGVPTLVEIKRKGDTRLRREVVGQMLDYAANAVSYWTAEAVRERYAQTCEQADVDPDELLLETFPEIDDPEVYWQSVRTNLSAGRLRLIFLADEIPSELRAIVEFLNRQMSPAIVQAIEVSQYMGPDGSGQMLLAKLIGETEAVRHTKTSKARARRDWDKASWLATLAADRPPAEVEVATRIFAWAEQHAPPVAIHYGTGARYAGAMFGRDDNEAYVFPFYIYNYGSIEIQFGLMAWGTYPAFKSLEARQELFDRLSELSGVVLDPRRIDKRPNVPLSALEDPVVLTQFLSIMEWVFEQAEAHGR